MGLRFQESESGHIKTAYIPCSLCRRCKYHTRIVDNTSSFIAECQRGSTETAASISQNDNYLEQGFCSCFEQKGMEELSSEFGGKKRTKWAMPFAILAVIAANVIAFRENEELELGAIIVISLSICIVIALLFRKLRKKQ